jgi:DNA-binding response OmpR family regulator
MITGQDDTSRALVCPYGTNQKGDGEMSEQVDQRGSALVVEDDDAIREILSDLLVEAGFQTTCCRLGQTALELIEQQNFDLLLIDVGLPDMSGLLVCEQGRSHYGPNAAILIITADSRTTRLLTAFDLGADDFIAKPFNIEELMTRIEVKLARLPQRSSGSSGDQATAPHLNCACGQAEARR